MKESTSDFKGICDVSNIEDMLIEILKGSDEKLKVNCLIDESGNKEGHDEKEDNRKP